VFEAFAWGLLAASSLVLGALVVDVHRLSNRALGLVMAFGAGVLVSAVSFELVEEAVIGADRLGPVAFGFFTGTGVFTVGDWLISRAGYRDRKDISGGAPSASGLTIVLGTVLDGVPESAVLGLTLLTTGEIGVSMLVAVFISNLPEAIAASSGLVDGGWTKTRVLGMWTGIAVVSGVASAIGYGSLESASAGTIAFVQAFAAGAILTMLATSMFPEAYEHAGRPVGVATSLGFGLAYAIDWITS
jgi:ZIP family zinc transporter